MQKIAGLEADYTPTTSARILLVRDTREREVVEFTGQIPDTTFRDASRVEYRSLVPCTYEECPNTYIVLSPHTLTNLWWLQIEFRFIYVEGWCESVRHKGGRKDKKGSRLMPNLFVLVTIRS